MPRIFIEERKPIQERKNRAVTVGKMTGFSAFLQQFSKHSIFFQERAECWDCISRWNHKPCPRFIFLHIVRIPLPLFLRSHRSHSILLALPIVPHPVCLQFPSILSILTVFSISLYLFQSIVQYFSLFRSFLCILEQNLLVSVFHSISSAQYLSYIPVPLFTLLSIPWRSYQNAS